MARTIWTGALSFGLVNIPVQIVSAVVDRGVHFHLLHDKDGARLQEKRVCTKDGQEVAWNHAVRGYETKKNQFVQVTPAELEKLAAAKSKAIALESFVPLDQINPAYFQHPYYLRPVEGAGAPYALLRDVLLEAKRVGIARMVLRGKEQLVALRAVGPVLSLQTLWFADEVLEPKSVEGVPASRKPPPAQLALAQQLVKSLSADFDPGQYKDEYRERVLALVAAKAKGKTLEVPEAPQPPSNVLDLMSALKASLKVGSGKPSAAGGKAAKREPAESRKRRAG